MLGKPPVAFLLVLTVDLAEEAVSIITDPGNFGYVAVASEVSPVQNPWFCRKVDCVFCGVHGVLIAF